MRINCTPLCIHVCIMHSVGSLALRFGRVEACKVLITTGRSLPNAVTDVDCWTALHHAALNGQRYVIEFLLSLDTVDVVRGDYSSDSLSWNSHAFTRYGLLSITCMTLIVLLMLECRS